MHAFPDLEQAKERSSAIFLTLAIVEKERERERESSHFGSRERERVGSREGLETRGVRERDLRHHRQGRGRRTTRLLLPRFERRRRRGQSSPARSRCTFGRITNLCDLGVGDPTHCEHLGGPGSVALCWEGEAITYLFVLVAGTPRL